MQGPARGNTDLPEKGKRKAAASPPGSPRRRGYARREGDEPAQEFWSQEDIPALLGERMVGKSKFDYKGKCEQMSSYIKRLRGACSSMVEQTSGFGGERERLSAMLVELDEKHATERDALKDMHAKLEGDLSSMQKAKAAVEAKLQAASAENLRVAKEHEDKAEALAVAKAKVEGLDEQMNALKAARAEAEDKIKEAADAHAKLQEYNVDLQKHNSAMADKAEKAAEQLAKVQADKATVQGELATAQGQVAALDGQVAANKEQLADAAARKAEAEAKLAEADAEAKRVGTELADVRARLAASEAALDKSQKEAEERAAQITALTEAKFAVEAELQAASGQAASLTERVAALEDNLRAARDEGAALQGRLAAAQEEHAAVSTDLEAMRAEVTKVAESHAAELAASQQAAQEAAEAAEREAQAAAQAATQELQGVRAKAEAAAEAASQAAATRETALQSQVDEYKAVTGKSPAELKAQLQKAVDLGKSCASQEEHIASLQAQLQVAQARVSVLEQSAGDAQQTAERLTARNAELEAGILDADKRVDEMEAMRRRMHNQIMELKGNIRVFARVRPPAPGVEEGGDDAMDIEEAPLSYPAGSADTRGRCISLDAGAKSGVHDFTFDKVFGPAATQGEVFEEAGQLVQSALDGYRVCVFAYGQTGSGKTHTMLGEGNTAADERAGLIPRAMDHIFTSAEALGDKGWSFTMTASMLEVYNEQLQDLLKEDAGKPKRKAQPMDATKESAKLEIKHDGKNNPAVVVGATTVQVSTREELEALLERALKARSVGKTAMNARPSRSHCVFTLRIQGACGETNEEVDGVLNLIDLAGSERLSRSGATGERMKEAQHINKSLSALGDVIAALASGEKHVPFRNSKLTYLLQPCLGGDCKALMLCNVAHEASSASETLSTLRFAAKVNSVELKRR